MNRANPLPPEERRRALVDATLPLIREHGLTVSTRQIAEAAGIAEGTIFRVFSSKADLVDATIADAVSPDRLLERLDAEASGATLDAVVLAVVRVLQDHARDARLVFAALGHPRPDAQASGDGDGDARCRRPRTADLNARVAARVSNLLEPHRDALTVAPTTAADLLLALSFGSAFTAPEDAPPLAARAVADVLLHGFVKGN